MWWYINTWWGVLNTPHHVPLCLNCYPVLADFRGDDSVGIGRTEATGPHTHLDGHLLTGLQGYGSHPIARSGVCCACATTGVVGSEPVVPWQIREPNFILAVGCRNE